MKAWHLTLKLGFGFVIVISYSKSMGTLHSIFTFLVTLSPKATCVEHGGFHRVIAYGWNEHERKSKFPVISKSLVPFPASA